MRILIYGLNFAPELTGAGKYTGEMAAWLARNGHEVRVVTAPPYYPQWKVEPPYSSTAYRAEEIDGARVYRCPLWVPAKPSGLTRLVHLASFALLSLPAIVRQRRWRPEVIFAVEPTFFVAPIALLLGRLTGARTWLHIQDFELDAAFSLGILRGPLLSAARAMEAWIMRRFDTVSSISHSMVKRVKEKGVQAERAVFFPNWADTESLRPGLPEAMRFRTEVLKVKPAERVVLYSGNMGEKQGLEIVLDAAAALPDVKFVLCGDGASRSRLMGSVEERTLMNVGFLPLQPASVLPAMLGAADVHLVIQKAGAADLVMPSKLTGILSVGGAAIVTADQGTELYHLVSNHGVGVVVPPEDAAALTAAIGALLADEARLNSVRVAARGYAEQCLVLDSILGRAFAVADRPVAAQAAKL